MDLSVISIDLHAMSDLQRRDYLLCNIIKYTWLLLKCCLPIQHFFGYHCIKTNLLRPFLQITILVDILTSPKLVVKCTEKLFIYQIRIKHDTSSGQHIVSQSTWTTRPLSVERTGSESNFEMMLETLENAKKKKTLKTLKNRIK